MLQKKAYGCCKLLRGVNELAHGVGAKRSRKHYLKLRLVSLDTLSRSLHLTGGHLGTWKELGRASLAYSSSHDGRGN